MCFVVVVVIQESLERGLATERRERARADAAWMKQVNEGEGSVGGASMDYVSRWWLSS